VKLNTSEKEKEQERRTRGREKGEERERERERGMAGPSRGHLNRPAASAFSSRERSAVRRETSRSHTCSSQRARCRGTTVVREIQPIKARRSRSRIIRHASVAIPFDKRRPIIAIREERRSWISES